MLHIYTIFFIFNMYRDYKTVIEILYLTKISAFLRNNKVSLFVGASEQSSVVEVVRVGVVGLAAAQRHPEEVVGFTTFN